MAKVRKTQTQNQWVLSQLRRGRKLTAKQAMDRRGIMQMGTRIFELREMGYAIESPLIKVKNRYRHSCWVAQYYLPSPVW